MVRVEPDKPGGQAIGPNRVFNPVSGWMAVNNRRSKRGMIFIFDLGVVRYCYEDVKGEKTYEQTESFINCPAETYS